LHSTLFDFKLTDGPHLVLSPYKPTAIEQLLRNSCNQAFVVPDFKPSLAEASLMKTFYRISIPVNSSVRIYFLALILTLLCGRGHAQRNFIDVPSSDIVGKSQYFTQVQAQVSDDELSGAILFTYGLGYNWEAGIGVERLKFGWSDGIAIDDQIPSENPAYIVNLQKGFILTSNINLGVGTRTGFVHAAQASDSKVANFNYVNCHSSIMNDAHRVTAGVYHGNQAYLGEGSGWGVMGGMEASLIREKLNFQADFFSGKTNISVINTGLEFALPRDWRITLGAQFPFPGRADETVAALFQIAKN
jgi:hypothetical protein